ncbi:MAG: c-type cytochrome [Pseudomonadota bacterium]
MKKILAALAVTCFATPTALAVDGGDPAAGEANYRQCVACHQVGETAVNTVGPQLNGIIGRTAASAEGYAYGPALAAKAEDVGEWDVDELMEYLIDPASYIGGVSKMPMRYPDEQFRLDVLAYLAQFNADGTAAE